MVKILAQQTSGSHEFNISAAKAYLPTFHITAILNGTTNVTGDFDIDGSNKVATVGT